MTKEQEELFKDLFLRFSSGNQIEVPSVRLAKEEFNAICNFVVTNQDRIIALLDENVLLKRYKERTDEEIVQLKKELMEKELGG